MCQICSSSPNNKIKEWLSDEGMQFNFEEAGFGKVNKVGWAKENLFVYDGQTYFECIEITCG